MSWAVPKGPTLDSTIRRMAVHVEDHPIEYFDFEGVIPAKQYGSGDVIVWDWGTWEPEAPTLDPRKAVADGELKFRLHGEKLKGRFTIVRTSGRRRKGDDPAPEPSRTTTASSGCSSTSGTTTRSPAGTPRTTRRASRPAGPTTRSRPTATPSGSARRRPRPPRSTSPAPWTRRCPSHIEPMLATLASKPFSDPDWLFEIKWDGYRVQAVVAEGKVRIWTRNLNDAETYFPRLLTPPSLDRRPRGDRRWRGRGARRRRAARTSRCSRRGSASRARRASSTRRSTCCTSTAGRCSTSRSRIASGCSRACCATTRGSASRPTSKGRARRSTRRPQASGLEGIIAKLRRSRYEPGRRTNAWLKLKIRPEQELVVGGWTPGEGNARDLGALAVGVYEDGKLRFGGKVGSGFTGAIRKDLLARLKPLGDRRAAVRPAAAEGLPRPLGRRPRATSRGSGRSS